MTKDTIQDFVDTLGYVPFLGEGDHSSPLGGACVMEMVSFLDNDWTDTPSCTMKFIAKVAQLVNDRLPDSTRYFVLSQFDRLFGTSELNYSEELRTAFFADLHVVANKWHKIATDQGYNPIYAHIFEGEGEKVYKSYLDKAKEFLKNTSKWEDSQAEYVFGQIFRMYVLNDQQKVGILSDILDVADNVLGRDEVVPVDKSRLKELESVRPSFFNQVRYEPS